MHVLMFTQDGQPYDRSIDRVQRYQLGDGDDQPPRREAWYGWLDRHGIDRRDVVVSGGGQSGYIERRIDAYQVAWLGIRGRHVVEKVLQLKGPPLAFPDEVMR